MTVRGVVSDTFDSLRTAWWFWSYVGLEVSLFVGGWAFDQIGQPNTGLGTHPDVHDSMGAVFGALGLTFGVAGLLALLLVLVVRIRDDITQSRPTW